MKRVVIDRGKGKEEKKREWIVKERVQRERGDEKDMEKRRGKGNRGLMKRRNKKKLRFEKRKGSRGE